MDLKLGMTKKQLDDHECKHIAQAKLAEGLEQAYNFDETHSVNPVAGWPDDGTAYTKTMNHSLGDTAYNVVVGDDDSETDDKVAEPYKDKEGALSRNPSSAPEHRQATTRA